MVTVNVLGAFQRPDPSMPEPRIPVIDDANKGGLGVDELRTEPITPVQVTAPIVPGGVTAGDTLVLYWDDQVVDSYVISQEQVESGLLLFSVNPSYILDGPRAEVRYHAFTALGGNEAVSFSYYVRVNTKVPGDPDPVPSTPTLNENLSRPNGIPAVIDDAVAQGGVDVTIVPWIYMEEGDVLTLTWGETKLVQPPLTLAQIGRPVLIHVDEATILATSNTLGLKVFYDIRDIVGNWSLLSLPAITDVEAGPNNLPAPRVREAQGDNDIDLAELGASNAHVDIPVYSPWSVGDSIVLNWLGRTPGGDPVNQTRQYITQPGDEGFPITLEIDNAIVVAVAGGNVIVYYEVNGLHRSRRTPITVSGAAQQLPAPEVREQVGGVLDPDAVSATGATVVIKAYPGMSSSDQILLYWNGTTADGGNTLYTDQRSGNNLNQDVIFQVPKDAHVVPLAGGSVRVHYKVLYAGGTTSPDSISLSLAVRAASADLDLLPPEVPKSYDNGTRLNFDTAMYYDDYLSVIVRYFGMAIGQRIELRWRGTVPYSPLVHIVTTVGPIEFRIPRLEVIDMIGRSLLIDYIVTLPDGSHGGTSRALPLAIDPQPFDLVAPTISPDRRTVTVQYPGMNAPHTGRVRWTGISTHDTPEQDLDTRPENFSIPSSWVTENAGREVLINYTVYRRDQQHFLFSRVLRQRL